MTRWRRPTLSRSRRLPEFKPGRPLIPDPIESLEAEARFAHRDLGGLSAAHLWAESTTLEAELADRLTRRIRSRLIVAWPTPVDEHRWLLGRIRKLRAEQRRRGLHVG